MARTVRIGGARVDITGNDAQFQQVMRRAGTAFRRQEAQLKRARTQARLYNKSLVTLRRGIAGLVAAFAGGLGVRALASSIKEVTTETTALVDAANNLGIAATRLQPLRYVFEQDGVAAEQLDKSIQRLGKSLGDAERGLSTALIGFERLGLNWRDLIDSDLDYAFVQVIRSLSGVENQAIKTATAQDILGRAGVRLIGTADRYGAAFGVAVANADKLTKATEEQLQTLKDLDSLQTEINAQVSDAAVRATSAWADELTIVLNLWKDIRLFIGEAVEEVGRAQTLDPSKFERDVARTTRLLRGGFEGTETGRAGEEIRNMQAFLSRTGPEALMSGTRWFPLLPRDIRTGFMTAIVPGIDTAEEELDKYESLFERFKHAYSTYRRYVARELSMLEREEAIRARTEVLDLGVISPPVTTTTTTGPSDEEIARRQWQRRLLYARRLTSDLEYEARKQAEAQRLAGTYPTAARAREFERNAMALVEQQQMVAEKAREAAEVVREAYRSAARSMSDSFGEAVADVITNFRSLQDAVRNLIGSIIADLARLYISRPISNAIFSALGAGTNLPGGDIQAGPRSASYVPRAAASGGGGNTVVFSPTIQGVQDPGIVRAELRAILPDVVDAAQGSLVEDLGRPSFAREYTRRRRR